MRQGVGGKFYVGVITHFVIVLKDMLALLLPNAACVVRQLWGASVDLCGSCYAWVLVHPMHARDRAICANTNLNAP